MSFFKKVLAGLLICGFFFSPAVTHAAPVLNPDDEALLDLIEKKSFDYFLQEVNRSNGLVPDRAHNFKKGNTSSPASIAAVGFALTAYPVGVERGWIDRSTAFELTRRTLDFMLRQAPQEHGFLYHFLNMETGERSRGSELSPIDTALFLAGALFAAEYFDHAAIHELADQLYERVDFAWMLNNGKTLALAWSPEQGFLRWRWDHYNESMILYLLAIGSPTHPIPAESWKEIIRPVGSYKEHRVIQIPPLFTHQYSHIWIDFRNRHDGIADYFQNSVNASKANRAFCIDQAAQFRTYGPNAWGLTASDGPFGYKAYGAPPGWAEHDGTLAPTGCGASIVFTPEESIACLRHFYETYQDKLWGLYGFSDAFNVDKNWFDEEVIGIDQGALLLMIENYRTEMIWDIMGRNAALAGAMQKVGFQPGTIELPWPEAPSYNVPYVTPGGMQVDGYLRDWADADAIRFDSTMLETGQIKDERDFSGEIRFAWNENHLYFAAKVRDNDLVAKKFGQHLWKDDVLELFIDPENNGLYWQHERDFQLGFRPEEETGGVVAWSWFQEGFDPLERGFIEARSFVDEGGYILEGAIDWRYLNLEPTAGQTVRLSPALHDFDRDRSEAKLLWHFRNEEGFQRFMLGRLMLQENRTGAEVRP